MSKNCAAVVFALRAHCRRAACAPSVALVARAVVGREAVVG